MKKRIISLLTALLLLCSIPCFAFAETTAKEAGEGVVRIVEVFTTLGSSPEKDVSTPKNFASGFFVGKYGEAPQYIVTSYQAVADFVENGQGTQIEYYPHGAKYSLRVYFNAKDYEELRVIDSDANQDIALLKLEKPTDKRVPLALEEPTKDMKGDGIHLIGYPGNTEDHSDATSMGNWGAEDSYMYTGTFGKLDTQSGTGYKWIQSKDLKNDLKNDEGSSGGAIVTEAGYVIGLASWKLTESDPDSMSVGLSVEHVIEMLNRNSVAFDTMEEREEAIAPPTEEPVPTEEPEPTEEPTEDAEEEGLDKKVLIAIIGGAVLLAAVLITVIVIRSKKAKQPMYPPEGMYMPNDPYIPATMAAPPSIPVPTATPAVRSLAVQHGGKKVPIGDQAILVGRSGECRIVYAENTPGVSGRHCAIAWDATANEFIIKDLNSTYGTYLDSGMKLDPNRVYRLREGDSFYLGEKANMLRVELE